MPTIETQRAGVCRACGGRVRRGELADFEAEKGVAHLEEACRTGTVRFRPNRRAQACSSCRTQVKAGEGLLRLLEDRGEQGGGKRWAVDCARCARL